VPAGGVATAKGAAWGHCIPQGANLRSLSGRPEGKRLDLVRENATAPRDYGRLGAWAIQGYEWAMRGSLVG
jgi:hypothetical protein